MFEVHSVQDGRHSQSTLANTKFTISQYFTDIGLKFDAAVAESHYTHTECDISSYHMRINMLFSSFDQNRYN